MVPDTWRPGPQDYLEALQDQNPWGQMGKVPEVLAKPSRRPLAQELWRAMTKDPYRYQVVIGPRRVGKTVVLYQTIQQLLTSGLSAQRLWFLRLDHPLLMHYHLGGWARSLIRRFHAKAENPLFLFLDEVNYSKDWDKWLKTFYDEKWPLRVVATSSSTAALRHRSVESGIGRWSEQFLTPYTFDEFLALRGVDVSRPQCGEDLFQTICGAIESRADHAHLSGPLWMFLLVGGFPELLDALVEDDVEAGLFRSQQVLRSEAVQRVAGMDIPQAFDIKNPLTLERLLYVLAGQMCGLMNVSKLAADLELARPTTHQYIDYLQQAYLIFTLPNYSTNEEAVQRKGRKVYFLDGAVRNAALQRGLSPLHDSSERGYLVENAVAAHLYALALQSGMRLYHWRDVGDEVDLVYHDPSKPIAVEVSVSGGHHLKGLRAIQKRYPELRGRCFVVSESSGIYNLPEADPDGIGRMPLSAFLLAVGAQTRACLARRLLT